MSDKRYQVFISSTFRDLMEERQSVLKAVLEMDHMPAGMELFPAADESAWQLIKDVIDTSDYYVLLVGGRYGSLDKEGLGYTEKEYDYARKSKRRVLALLHQNPDNLPRGRTETDPTAWEKLQAFRKKVEENHHCSYWSTAEELKAKVIVGLSAETKRHPATGWVRADTVPSGATIQDVLSLRTKVSELEREVERLQTEPPSGTEELQQGEDSLLVFFTFYALAVRGPMTYHEKRRGSAESSWNNVFASVAPALINDANDRKVRHAFKAALLLIVEDYLDAAGEGWDGAKPTITNEDTLIDTCLIQFRALGLLRESDRKRSVTDTNTYWRLTPYGDRLMVQLRALRRGEDERLEQSVEFPEDESDSSGMGGCGDDLSSLPPPVTPPSP